MFAAWAEVERARTGSVRLEVGSFVDRIEEIEFAKAVGSLRLLILRELGLGFGVECAFGFEIESNAEEAWEAEESESESEEEEENAEGEEGGGFFLFLNFEGRALSAGGSSSPGVSALGSSPFDWEALSARSTARKSEFSSAEAEDEELL